MKQAASSVVSGSAQPAVPASTVRTIVELACRAPSIYNTQPWKWRSQPDGVDLHADPSRQLAVADPLGRSMVLSCGTALHHAQVAALALGWQADISRLPDPSDPTLLARIRLTPVPPPPTAAGELAALRDRFTDRRRFTSWPVPPERLERLAEVAEEAGGRAEALTDVTDSFRTNLLIARALHLQSRDAALAEERNQWLGRPGPEGVPLSTVPDRPAPDESHLSRFGLGELADDGRDSGGTDGLVLFYGETDTPLEWLRAGEALSALWLRAVRDGLSVVPLTQVVEVPETRAALVHEVLGRDVVPLIVVRVGWQAISRKGLEPSPRRPLEAVLDA
jgi:nitroreductase